MSDGVISCDIIGMCRVIRRKKFVSVTTPSYRCQELRAANQSVTLQQRARCRRLKGVHADARSSEVIVQKKFESIGLQFEEAAFWTCD